MNSHLSGDQISGWIAGERRRERHLRECAACRAKVDRAEQLFVSLGVSVRCWSRGRTPAAGVLARTAGWRWAAVAAMAAMAAAGVYRYAGSGGPPDAALLDRVDAALSRSVPESMAPLAELAAEDRAR